MANPGEAKRAEFLERIVSSARANDQQLAMEHEAATCADTDSNLGRALAAVDQAEGARDVTREAAFSQRMISSRDMVDSSSLSNESRRQLVDTLNTIIDVQKRFRRSRTQSIATYSWRPKPLASPRSNRSAAHFVVPCRAVCMKMIGRGGAPDSLFADSDSRTRSHSQHGSSRCWLIAGATATVEST